jgi:hypothetical protein
MKKLIITILLLTSTGCGSLNEQEGFTHSEKAFINSVQEKYGYLEDLTDEVVDYGKKFCKSTQKEDTGNVESPGFVVYVKYSALLFLCPERFKYLTGS